MLRNAVLHLHNEQPLVADVFELPSPTDTTIRLTNLRTLDGKRPVFADDMKSIFVFPYHRISFVEIPPQPELGTEFGDAVPLPVAVGASVPQLATETPDEEDLEIDEDFLRRIREV
jgi:hypothetical protein